MEHCSFSKSELSLLWNRKNKRYIIKSFIKNGQWITHIVFNDRCCGGNTIGKLVNKSSGEFHHRPWLHHRNLASLIDMVTIDDRFNVFMSAYQEKSLREVVNDEKFIHNSNCFILKKTYIEDVLWGLDYLHRNDLCLMNLSDANVYICEQPNKAIITDFGRLTSTSSEGGFRFSVPIFHQPPELNTSTAQCDPIAAEMWVMGMMILEVFAQHRLPWALVDYDPDRAIEMIGKVDFKTLKVANVGSALSIQDLCEFKKFVNLFLDENPQNRCCARDAASTIFLQSPKYTVFLKKASFCSVYGNTCSEKNVNVRFSPNRYRASNSQTYSRSNSNIHALKSPRYRHLENKTGKSKSSSSFKKCDCPSKKVHSLSPSKYTQQSNCEHKDEDVSQISNLLNQGIKVNSDTKVLKNVDSTLQENKASCSEDVQSLTRQITKHGSNMSSSSQVGLKNSLISEIKSFNENELNSDVTSAVSVKSLNEKVIEIKKLSPCDTYNYLSPYQSEKSNSEKTFSSSMERYAKNILDACSKRPNDKTDDNSPRSVNLENNSSEKNYVPCGIETCAFSNYPYNDPLLQTSSDQLYIAETLRNHGNVPTQNQMDNHNRKSKSLICQKNSVHKSRIPIPNYYRETCFSGSKIEPKIASKTPYTLSKNNVPSLPKMNTNIVPDPVYRTQQNKYSEQVIEPAKSNYKRIPQGEIKRLEEDKEHLNLVMNAVEPCDTHTYVLTRSPQHPTEAAKFKIVAVPEAQEKVKKITTHCRFEHGYRCPKHQKAALEAQFNEKITNQDNNFNQDATKCNHKNNCKAWGNTCMENKVPYINCRSASTSHDTSSLPHCYWFPPSTLSNTRDTQMLSPSPLSRNMEDVPAYEQVAKEAAYGTRRMSYTKAIWKRDNLHKNNNVEMQKEEGTKQEDKEQKNPATRKRCLFRVQVETQTRCVTSSNKVVKGKSKKCQKPSTKTADYLIIEDSSDEKKSKKRNALKKCFCIGK